MVRFRQFRFVEPGRRMPLDDETRMFGRLNMRLTTRLRHLREVPFRLEEGQLAFCHESRREVPIGINKPAGIPVPRRLFARVLPPRGPKFRAFFFRRGWEIPRPASTVRWLDGDTKARLHQDGLCPLP